MSDERSPYLAGDNRLGDVIAAIQVMGTYKFYKLNFAAWSERITGDESRAGHWRTVFEEHPEFFRLDGARRKASLVWRRQHQRLFDVDRETKLTKGDLAKLSPEERERISRMPLNSAELGMLINTAINLHSRALERKKETRWWVPVVIPLTSAAIGFLGAFIGAYIRS